jgi:hypothetical protein
VSTAADVRKLVLKLDEVEEKSHFGSPSFRRAGKIFIQTSDKNNEAIFKLSPAHQEMLLTCGLTRFVPKSGARSVGHV